MAQGARLVGQIIRDLRKKQNMTGEELGKRAGLSQSKVSKLETGLYARPDYDQIQRILNILGASSTIRQQALHALKEGRQSVGHASFHDTQPSVMSAELERRSRRIRLYAANAIPALLQTVEYRTALLRSRGYSESEIPAFIKHTLLRQDLLWDKRHVFHIIFPQAALYTRIASKREHRAQLDRLERLIGTPNIVLGIIPVEAGHILSECSSFVLYDDTTLIQAVARYEITSQDRQDIVLHSDIFTSFERLAYYDNDAIQLTRAAMDYLS